jgi:hypothetical protein
MLNDEQLWDKCGTNKKITHDDIVLDPQNYHNNTQTYTENFELASDIDIFREIGVSLIITIGATIALHMFITK